MEHVTGTDVLLFPVVPAPSLPHQFPGAVTALLGDGSEQGNFDLLFED